MTYVTKDDFRQIGVVTKNELVKSLRGRNFYMSLGVILLIFSLITLLPYMTGNPWGSDTTAVDVLSSYFDFASMVTVLIVALIASVALVSEFEDRTALILFTRPIKRTTIFVGKLLSCMAILTMIMGLYYLLVTAMLLIFPGTVPGEFLISFGFCVLYIFATTGIAFLISTMFKRGSICTIMSILLMAIVIPIITMMIGGDTWYMLDTAGNSMLNSIPEYVDGYNETIIGLTYQLEAIIELLKASGSDSVTAESIRFLEMLLSTEMMGFMSMKHHPQVLREALVLLGWGGVALSAAWMRFIRKEF
jgi:ABC-2 type transport system permease protein